MSSPTNSYNDLSLMSYISELKISLARQKGQGTPTNITSDYNFPIYPDLCQITDSAVTNQNQQSESDSVNCPDLVLQNGVSNNRYYFCNQLRYVPLDSAHVLWLPFQKHTCDATLTQSTGKAFNSPVFVAGVTRYGLQFNGTTQYLQVPDSTSLQLTTWTICLWVYVNSIGALQALIIKSVYSNARNYSLSILASGKIECGIGNGTSFFQLTSAITLSANKWYHIAFTFDGVSAWKVYINGQLDNSQTVAVTPNLQAGVLNIAANNGGGNFFGGVMDDINIFNTVLSQADIQTVMAIGQRYAPDAVDFETVGF